VGSGDGWVYAFEAATGRPQWQFRAAPEERMIPVYGTLSSNWPVASGVLVDDGTVYAAAGIASYDGTHVYALDAPSGKIRWQNNTSGNLVADDERVTGISVQGHLLLNEGKLYMPGGNVVSPAVYDAATGKCENTLGDEWQKGPRGRELFLVDGQVRVFDQLLYSPKEYQQARYFSQGYFVQAGSGEAVVRGTVDRLVRLDPKASTPEKPVALWESKALTDITALAVCKNVALVAGRTADGSKKPALVALDLESGNVIWSQALPEMVTGYGICVDRDGRVVVTLRDGQAVCYR
jgi:outer membrane protein assembly factor BamB